MDVVTLALCKRICAGALSGVASMSVEDQTLNIECVDGTHLEMHFPEPVSIVDAEIDENSHLILTLSDGSTIDAGLIPGGGGGSGSLEADLTASLTVGGVTSGTFYEEGTPLEKILRYMLNPGAYPTLTPPSAVLTATGDKLLEKGSTLDTVFTLTFNRGRINPAYGTSGYRSGVATSYTFDGETKATNTFSRTITEDKLVYQGSVAYEAGEQPKDSKGNNYSTPLPAGSVNSSRVEYEFVDAWWGNGNDPDVIEKIPLISKKPGTIDITFAPVDDDQAEKFDIPASWTLTAIKVYNPLSLVWDTITSQFTPTDVTHEDAAGQTVAYKRYTCNLGYGMGERELKIEWSTT